MEAAAAAGLPLGSALIAGSYRDLRVVIADKVGSNPPAIFKGLKESVFRNIVDADAIYPAESSEDWLDRLRKAHEREPGNAAAYYLYANLFKEMRGEVPPDFKDVTATLEPDNAIWSLLRADWQTGEAIKHAIKPERFDPVWMDQAIDSIKEAAACPRIDFHSHEIDRLWREGIHPQAVLEVVAISPVTGSDDRFVLHPEGNAKQAFRSCAAYLTEPEKRQAFLRISGPLLVRAVAENEDWSMSPTLERQAKSAGLDEDAARFGKLDRLSSDLWEVRHRLPKKEGFSAILDTPKFWPDFYQDWDSSGLDLRLLNRVAALKSALLASGAVCLLAGSVVWLRMIPIPAMSAKLSSCVAPLVNRRSRIIRAAMVLFVMMFATWGLAGVVSESEQREGARLLIVTLSAATLLGLSFAFQSARVSVSTSAAMIGLGGSRRQLLLGRLVKWLSLLAVGFWIASTYASDFQLFTIALTGCILIYWMIRLVLGFAKPVDNVRHRLMAGMLVPVFFTVSIGFALAGLGTGAVEKHLVQKAWASAPEPRQEISAENRAALEALAKEWQ